MPLRQRNLCSDCVCVCVITLSFLRISNVEIVYLTCLSDYWLEVEVGTQLKNSFLTFLSWLTGVREAFQSEPSGLAYFVSFILEVPPLLLLYWWDLEELAVKYEECVTPMMPLVLVNISRVNGGQPHTLHCYSAKQRVTSCSCSCKRKSDGVCSEWTPQNSGRAVSSEFSYAFKDQGVVCRGWSQTPSLLLFSRSLQLRLLLLWNSLAHIQTKPCECLWEPDAHNPCVCVTHFLHAVHLTAVVEHQIVFAFLTFSLNLLPAEWVAAASDPGSH